MTELSGHALPQGDFRIGQLFRRAWNRFTANFWCFFTVTAISELPARAYFWWANARPAGVPGSFEEIRTIVMFLAFVLVLVGQAVLVCIAFQTLRARAARVDEALQEVLARSSPILGLSFLICLVIFGLVRMLMLSPSLMFAVLFMVVSSVLIVTGSVALPACVAERLGPVDSLKRSANLTKGHRWKIFGIIVLVWTLIPIASAPLRAALSSLGPAAQDLGQFIWAAVWIAYFNSILITIYHDLRVAKEGIDTEWVAAVFD